MIPDSPTIILGLVPLQAAWTWALSPSGPEWAQVVMGFQQEYHMEAVMCQAGQTLPKQSQHNPNSCLEQQHTCSQSYCHPIGAGEPEKKTELAMFLHCGRKSWDCHPNISSKIETTWDCSFFNNPNFSGIGIVIPVL